MRYLSIVVFTIFYCLFFKVCYAQTEQGEIVTSQKEKTELHFDFGAYITFGYARINNLGSIEQYYELLKSENPYLSNKKFKAKWGTSYGFSPIASLIVNDRFHLDGGILYQSQKNKFELLEESTFSSDSSNKIFSVANLSFYSISIPIVTKVRFLIEENNPFDGETHPYIKAGISYEIRFSKKIDFVENNHEYFGADPYTTAIPYSKVNLDGLNTTAFNYIIGVGADFVLFEHNKTTFFLEMIFTSTFGKEELWSNNLPQAANNSEVFDKSKQEIIQNNYNISVSDWKNSNIKICMGLLF